MIDKWIINDFLDGGKFKCLDLKLFLARKKRENTQITNVISSQMNNQKPFQKREEPIPNNFIGEFCQTFKEEYKFSTISPRKQKHSVHILTYSMRLALP